MANIIAFILLLTLTQSFYIFLDEQMPQCFYTQILREQQLLLEVETTIVSVAHKIILQVKNKDKTLLDK